MKNDVDEPARIKARAAKHSKRFVFFPKNKKIGGRCAAVAEAAQDQSGYRKSGGTRFSLADPTEGTIECHAVSHARREPRAQKGATEGLKQPYRRSLSINPGGG